MKMEHPYLLSWLEAARLALQDADFFDYCADSMDLSDAEMQNLRNTLQDFLGE